MIICSACLLGLNTRYDGRTKLNPNILDLSRKVALIPVCPEQLGGLATPRDPSEKLGDQVITSKGRDVTEQFNEGARQVLKIAKALGVKKAIMKEKSASCGMGKIYDGTFSRNLIDGNGVTTKMLIGNGIEVIPDSAAGNLVL